MQWFNLRLCSSLEFLVLTLSSCFTVIPSSPRQSVRPSAAAITNPFFCGASKSPDVQARAFNLSVSARRCLLRVLPFNVISFSCLWALITFYFFDNTSATSPSQNLLRHSALKSKHAESLQRRSHFNWLISIKEAFFHFTQKLHKDRSCWCDPKTKVETGEQNNQITNLELSLFSFYLHVRVLSLVSDRLSFPR